MVLIFKIILNMFKLPIEISARHMHVSRKDLDLLFGKGYELTVKKNISQPGQFAAAESVKIITKKGELNLRIVGPVRAKTQVELSLTDAFKLGINPPTRVSGNLVEAAAIKIIGPKKTIIRNCAIIAKRHVHLSVAEARKLKVKNGQKVAIKIGGDRGLIFNNVIVRSGDGHKLAAHFDTDEGNAAGINRKILGELLI